MRGRPGLLTGREVPLMVVCWWASGLACALPASASSPGRASADAEQAPDRVVAEVVAPPEPDRAEYHRLSLELEALVARNAWAGVERTFQELLATGVTPSYGDWMRGAESARLEGDVQEVYARLLAAKDRSEENRTAVEWLWELDKAYGSVFLACDPGSNLVLASDVVPFDPGARRAIEYAQAQVRDRCLFQGRLPEGTYRFYTHTVDVRPKVQSVYVDLRGTEIPRSERRDLKRAHEEQAAAVAADP